MLEIIPAIDIRAGRCVRLYQGDIDKEKIYSNDPASIAKIWEAFGARRLHIVDLDGAFTGKFQNWDIIKKIRKNVNCIIQVGGGIRQLNTIKKLKKIGINKIILGTSFIFNPKVIIQAKEIFGNDVMISIDIKNKFLSIAGWKEITSTTLQDAVERLLSLKIQDTIVTDIKKDGTLNGIDKEFIDDVVNILKGFSIYISGGINSLDDLNFIKNYEGVKGVIIGKALYEEKIKLSEIQF